MPTVNITTYGRRRDLVGAQPMEPRVPSEAEMYGTSAPARGAAPRSAYSGYSGPKPALYGLALSEETVRLLVPPELEPRWHSLIRRIRAIRRSQSSAATT